MTVPTLVNVWIMNDAGAISEAVTREIVVENGQITAGIDGAAPIVDVTVTLSAPSDLVYSGEEKAAFAVSAGADLTEEDYTVNYTRTTDSGQSVPVGHAPVSAGSYTAVFALTESGAQKYGLAEDSVTAISYIINLSRFHNSIRAQSISVGSHWRQRLYSYMAGR